MFQKLKEAAPEVKNLDLKSGPWSLDSAPAALTCVTVGGWPNAHVGLWCCVPWDFMNEYHVRGRTSAILAVTTNKVISCLLCARHCARCWEEDE